MNLIIFLKGGITYKEIEEMPISKIYELNNIAHRINKKEQ